MHNFLIGLYGKYDEEKMNTDFREGFYGVEASMFPDVEEVGKLVRCASRHGFCWGAHYPLVKKNNGLPRDPLFLSPDRDIAEISYDAFEKEARMVSESGGKYLLTHFPKPVLVHKEFDIENWRFDDDKDWIYASAYPQQQFLHHLTEMFEKLNAIAGGLGLDIVLEHDAVHPLLFSGNILPTLFAAHKNLSACIDTGRLHLQALTDPLFRGITLIEILAEYTSLVHLSNTTLEANLYGGHLPVSPAQLEKDGYGDIKKYLDALLSINTGVKFLFEHKSQGMTREALDNCYGFVDTIQKAHLE